MSSINPIAQPEASNQPPTVTTQGSGQRYQWLVSLAFTTYQTNRLFSAGHKENNRLAINERLFSFPGSDGIITTEPTEKRPGLSQPTQVADLPSASQSAQAKEQTIPYQKVSPLSPENLLPYESVTHPNQKNSWLENKQNQIELISLYVLPAYQNQSIEKPLQPHLQQIVHHSIPNDASNNKH